MAGSVSKEIQFNIWDNDEGVSIQVAQDSDSLGLVEVRPQDKKAEDYWGKFRMVINSSMARAVGEAMIAMADDIEAQEKKK